MALESATYISGLVAANPPGTDAISQGDDHIRLIKTVLKASLPNADAAINGIHTGASAPSSTSAGQLWFDTSANLIKMRNEADGGWIVLAASEGSRLLSTTNTTQGAVTITRSETYVDAGYSITHDKLSSTSVLYVTINATQHSFSSWGDLGCANFYSYIRLADTSGALVTNSTDNIQISNLRDLVPSGCSTVEVGNVFSWTWRVTAADCPDATSGNNTFDIWAKVNDADDGGISFSSGVMTVWEVEE
tara:strand:+ start:45 stop:788 length:744 start_codon:yes stop_codon:yes gene_type:complete